MHPVSLQPLPRRWLDSSPIGQFSEPYQSHLIRARYAQNTVRIYLCCVAHFAHWLSSARINLVDVNEAARGRFLRDHLPLCNCPCPVRRAPHDLHAAITHLFTVLRSESAIPDNYGTTELDGEIKVFDAYMRDVAGLAANTRRQRRRIVGHFLQDQFGDRKIDMTALAPITVRCFVLGESKGWSAGTIRVAGGAVGCYLRFCRLRGDAVSSLRTAIPRIAHWRLAGLPEVLTSGEIDTLLASFAQDFPSRRRAYAMVRCLTDLGLRSHEVVQLQLDDIDWRQGIVCISGTKARRSDVLPLLAETGRAIASYLRHERPQTTNRAIFVRHVAPYDLPIQRGTVRRAVIDAYRRCGWAHTRIHTLRHSVASRLINSGVSMKEVADILRHRSPDTTMVYTKIDLQRLAHVAMPWPGGKT